MQYSKQEDTTMTINEIKNLAQNQIFSVKFIKKDGSLREMVCRLGVKKHLKGGELAYDAKSLGYLPVFDMQKEDYRMINTNTIVEIKINGQVYKF
jgi:hypothetical protein